jgi:hypothetical protein
VKRYGYRQPTKSLIMKRSTCAVKIGGFRLTPEAERSSRERNTSLSELMKQSDYDVDLVFTRPSVASLHTIVQFTYMVFEVAGPLALASAGLLLTE